MPRDYRPATRRRAAGADRRGPDPRRRWALLIFVLLAGGILALVVSLRAILFPFVIAAIIAYVLEPLVARVERRGLPRWVSVIVVFVLFVTSVWGFSYALFPKLLHEGEKGVQRLQAVLREAPQIYAGVEDRLERWLTPDQVGRDGRQGEENIAETTGSRWGLGPNLMVTPVADELPSVPILDQVRLGRGADALAAAEALSRAREEGPVGEFAEVRARAEAEEDSQIIVEALGDGRFGVSLQESTLEVHRSSGGRLTLVPLRPDERVGGVGNVGAEIVGAIRKGVERVGSGVLAAVLGIVQSFLQGLSGAMVGLVLVFMVAAFILLGADSMRRFFRNLVPARYETDYDDLLHRLDRGLSGVVRGQLLICLVNGVLSFIGFSIFIPEYAIVLGIFAGVMSLVPIFGTIISSVPAMMIGLTDSFTTSLAVLAWILGIHFIEANFLNPKIIGTAAHIHPVIVIFALIAGEHVYGLPGVILSVPAVAIMQAIYAFSYQRIRPHLWSA